MLVAVLILASCIVTVTSSLVPCTTQKWEAAFLSNVTSGLPRDVQETFCGQHIADRSTISPADTGIVHYVLPGSLDTGMLGKHNGTWNILRVGDKPAKGPVQTPVLLHLWLRALCIGCVSWPRI